jgi:secreted PhoX family phosphatase
MCTVERLHRVAVGLACDREAGGATTTTEFDTQHGQVIFRFIQNNADLTLTPVNTFNQHYRGSEFAGACYSPDGKWLFVNIQSPGITFAITGPWGSGGI